MGNLDRHRCIYLGYRFYFGVSRPYMLHFAHLLTLLHTATSSQVWEIFCPSCRRFLTRFSVDFPRFYFFELGS